MKRVKPTSEQHEFIEHMGRWWETGTGSRVAGRILGWLIVCEPPHQSAADMVEALSISTGSVSTQIRLLEGLEFVERVTFPSDRSTYYQLKPDVWVHVMGTEPDHLKRMQAISEAGAAVVPEERPERLTDIGLIAGFFLQKWPGFMEELLEYLEEERQT
jgi:DNA-binding transcriptional regulator GbsR (MarR family)